MVVPPAYVLVPLKTRVPGPTILRAAPEPAPGNQLDPPGMEFALSSPIVPEKVTVLPVPGEILRVAPEIAKRSVPAVAPLPPFAETVFFVLTLLPVKEFPVIVTVPVLTKMAPPKAAPSPPT